MAKGVKRRSNSQEIVRTTPLWNSEIVNRLFIENRSLTFLDEKAKNVITLVEWIIYFPETYSSYLGTYYNI